MAEMPETIEFDEERHVAINHEVFDDEEQSGQWVTQRDTVAATRVRYGEHHVAFINDETDSCFLVNATNFLSAWTDDIHI